MKKFFAVLAVLAVILCVAAPSADAQIANVKSEFRQGNLYFLDYAGGTIFYIDGTNGLLNIDQAKFASQATQTISIPVTQIRSNAGAALTAAETAGTFDITIGTNTILVNGEVTDNETEASVAYAQVALPANYVAGTDVSLVLPSALIKTGSPTNNGSTLDLEVYLQSNAGAVGSDLCATAAVTYAALDTWYDKTFTITGTTLVPGGILNLKITSNVIDSEAGAGTIILNLAAPKMSMSTKG